MKIKDNEFRNVVLEVFNASQKIYVKHIKFFSSSISNILKAVENEELFNKQELFIEEMYMTVDEYKKLNNLLPGNFKVVGRVLVLYDELCYARKITLGDILLGEVRNIEKDQDMIWIRNFSGEMQPYGDYEWEDFNL